MLDALAERLTNAEIADRLCVSHRTVESHVSSLLRKFDVPNRRELANLARSRRRDSTRARRVPPAFDLAVESGPLVGRRCELDELRTLWRRARGGRTIVAVVTGEAGIGKSRLVAQFATEVHREGGRVLLGSCFEDLQNPYQPFADAISAGFEGMSPDEVRRELAGDVRALGRLVPIFLAETGTIDVVDAATERADVLAGIARHLVRTAQTGNVLLVLEDLHWASATTRDALRHLVRTSGGVPLLLLVTSRDTPPEATDDLNAVINELTRAPGAHHLRISGLDRHDVERLIASIPNPAFLVDSHTIYEQTGGNPLLVREMLAAGPGAPPSAAPYTACSPFAHGA